MEGFLDLRCPNRPFDGDNAKECRARLQGPQLRTVLAALRAGVPYVDTRFCTHCKLLWRVTIESETSLPVYEIIPKGTVLDLVDETDAFGLTGAAGRKLTRKASSR
jgi:hypothetical protein